MGDHAEKRATRLDNVRVDYRWAAGVAERFQTAAAEELVALEPDVILADTTPDWTAIRRCASRGQSNCFQGEMNHELNVTFQLTDWRPRHGDKCSAGYLFPTDPVITNGERSQRLLLNALRSFPA